jgi:hypothetical protein
MVFIELAFRNQQIKVFKLRFYNICYFVCHPNERTNTHTHRESIRQQTAAKNILMQREKVTGHLEYYVAFNRLYLSPIIIIIIIIIITVTK